jgi:hypothetical protein
MGMLRLPSEINVKLLRSIWAVRIITLSFLFQFSYGYLEIERVFQTLLSFRFQICNFFFLTVIVEESLDSLRHL